MENISNHIRETFWKKINILYRIYLYLPTIRL